MRVLMINASLDCGGAETHILTLGRGLLERGHEVTIASSGGRMVEEWLLAGGQHVKIPMKHSPVALPIAFVRLRRLLRENPPHVVHVHGRLAGILCHRIAKGQGIPLVSTVHAHFRIGLLHRLCRWGTCSIAVSEDLKQYLCEAYGVPPKKVSVIPNGIDTNRFSPSPRSKENTHRVLFLSRLDRDCSAGAYLLCDLAEELWREDPLLEICIAGDGTEKGVLARRGEEVNQRMGHPVIQMVGYAPNPEALYRESDVVLGVSRVALEAMSCATEVILGGNEGWIGHLSQGNLSRGARTNFCCRGEAPMTKDKLRQAIRDVFARDVEERESCGMALRDYVVRHHSLERMAEQTEEIYRSVLPHNTQKSGTTLLCGYYGYGNLGDDALLAASIRRTHEEGKQAVALTRRGRRDSLTVGAPCLHRMWLFGIWRVLSHTDRLVLGGGTLLQENTSRRSLLYYTTLIRMAKKRGVPVELWANGLGEPKSRWGEKRMGEALSFCKTLEFRDHTSCEIAETLLKSRPHPKIGFVKDMAMDTPSCTPERSAFLMERYGLREGSPYAIAVVHGRAKSKDLKPFVTWMDALLKQNIRPLLVPMYPREDEKLCKDLSERWHCPVTHGLGAEDLVGLMRGAHVVCGMRLHALVFAHSAGTPFVGFGGDPKIRSFCREWGGVYYDEHPTENKMRKSR